MPAAPPVSIRRILSLAVPALGALAAEPLFVLVDTAVVGHLGAAQLGGVALGGALLTNVAWLCNFLAYSTTGRAARLFGSGQREAAIEEGVQASYLAAGLGVLVVVLGQLLAGPATSLLAGDDAAVQGYAEAWLRVAVLGAPLIMLSLAGSGWMRGVQELRFPLVVLLGANVVSAIASPVLVYPLGLGVEGSAIANVAGQAIAVALFLRALARTGVPLRPRWDTMRAQLVMGKDLALRTLVMEFAFLSAAGVATRMGTDRIAAHQIALQLWLFLALVLDGLAVAAQTLIGERLGADDGPGARSTARRIAILGAWAGSGIAVLLAAGWWVVPRLFTSDPAVIAQAHLAWPWFVAMQPFGGVLFAIDGILVGAGDVAFMRNSAIAGALLGFVPITYAAYALDLGLGGVWAGLTAFVLIRLAAGVWRLAGGRWAVTGARL